MLYFPKSLFNGNGWYCSLQHYFFCYLFGQRDSGKAGIRKLCQPNSGYNGNCFIHCFTSSLTDLIVFSSSIFINTRSTSSTTVSISFSFIPLVVIAGTPIRIPEVTKGLLSSKGTAFLFRVI